VQWLNPAAYASAPEGRRGNSTRGQFRGPSYHVWDLSLRKQFVLSGDVRLQIQADFFNAFNMVNWGNPATNLSGSGFGNITSITGQPRNIQLGARLTF
jgi:outer membrane receptor for Fe3+-dicitrate